MSKKVSNGFSMFMKETTQAGKDYMTMVMQLSKESALDQKTHELAYVSVLSATRMLDGLNFHVHSAKELGASREEVKSAVLLAIPAVGITVMNALEVALNTYDED